jgi:hypothetical protein
MHLMTNACPLQEYLPLGHVKKAPRAAAARAAPAPAAEEK